MGLGLLRASALGVDSSEQAARDGDFADHLGRVLIEYFFEDVCADR